MTQTDVRCRRLVIVSNRLPFNVTVEDGALKTHESSGGLVTGLESFLRSIGRRPTAVTDYLWVGWPGGTIEDSRKEELKAKARAEFRSYPVFLSEQEMEDFYHGFCNKTLWPLFHYYPSNAIYDQGFWRQYTLVNERFCNAVLEIIDKDDIVWVHDYHLMLLPRMLSSRAPEVPIGFFLHIPFPSFELFRLLPEQWRLNLLEGMLGADLVGFHTHEYTQHFLQCVLRLLGFEHQMGQITLRNRIVRAETFPMGIDFARFSAGQELPEVVREREHVSQTLQGAKVILSLDRLDYTKGILHRLQGYELLLANNPQFHGKVVLVMIVIPSRVAVDSYEMMKKAIEELVGKINGKFGTLGWVPIIYQFRSVQFAPLVALYSLSDVALVTPLRDGMNLIAKEYIASRANERGVLVLSEMAGAAKELGEAIIINPNDIGKIAEALKDALEMPEEEQIRRNRIMRRRLRRYDVLRWADEFLRQLGATRELQAQFTAKMLKESKRTEIVNRYKSSSRRLLFLDYDGTLSPLFLHPRMAAPPASVLQLLRRLGEDSRNTVVLISGRDRSTMERWFGTLPISLVAEHGVWYRSPGAEWKLLRDLSNDWKPKIMPIFEQFADRLPGAFVEEKEYSIAWHYRGADPDQGEVRARELKDHLVNFTANIDVQVLQGSKVVEMRNAGVNKGAAALRWLNDGEVGFVLAIGDDWTDEDLFKALPSGAYSIKVGITNTHAQYNLPGPTEVIRFLEQLTA